MRDQVQHHLERARIAARAGVIGTVRRSRRSSPRCAHDGEDPPRPRHRDRHRVAAQHPFPRRAAGSGGDGRQPGRQCLQVGAVARAVEVLAERAEGRAQRRPCASSSTTTAPASPRGTRAGGGRATRRPVGRDKPGSGLGLSIVVDLAALYGGALDPRHRADRRPACRAGVAGGVAHLPEKMARRGPACGG